MNDRALLRVTLNLAPPAAPALLLGLSALTLLSGMEASFAYRREAVLDGEWLRLLSASFAHLTPGHALLNMSAAVLLWLYAGDMPARLWWFGIPLCSLGVGLGLLVFHPEISWYVGMSGMLHGMVPPIVVFRVLRHRDRLAVLLGAGLLLKTAAEQFWGADLGAAVLAGGEVVVAAHLWGAITGALLCLPMLIAAAGGKMPQSATSR